MCKEVITSREYTQALAQKRIRIRGEVLCRSDAVCREPVVKASLIGVVERKVSLMWV